MSNAAKIDTTVHAIGRQPRPAKKVEIVDAPGEFLHVDPAILFVDEAYQRQAGAHSIAVMAAAWSWVSCGAIVVGRRASGRLFVIDGQHRVMAARRAGISAVPCMVYRSDGVKSEAGDFLDLNTKRRSVNALGKYKAALVAGDPVALKLSAALQRNSLTVSGSGTGFQSVAWAMRAIRVDERLFDAVFDFVAQMSIASNTPLLERLPSGVFTLSRQLGGFSPRLSQRLQTVGAARLLEATRRLAAAEGNGGSACYARAILAEVNKGLQNKFRLISASEE